MAGKGNSAEELIASIDSVSDFSPASLKIIDIANRIDAEPADLTHAISMDPLVTARVLRLVNSAYFGMSAPVSSITRAVMLIGFNTIKNIALSSAIISKMKINSTFRWFNNDDFWKHSLACAIASRHLAVSQGVLARDADVYFVSGLLHDIAKVVMVRHKSDFLEEIYDPEYHKERMRHELEIEELNISHSALGGKIAEEWQFPPNLRAGIEFHHAPQNAPEEFQQLAATVQLADLLVHERNIGIQMDANFGNILECCENLVNIDEKTAAETIEEIESEVEDAKDFLNVEV